MSTRFALVFTQVTETLRAQSFLRISACALDIWDRCSRAARSNSAYRDSLLKTKPPPEVSARSSLDSARHSEFCAMAGVHAKSAAVKVMITIVNFDMPPRYEIR